MTPQALGLKMIEGIPAPEPGQPKEKMLYPFALVCISLDGTQLELIVPHIYHRLLQDAPSMKSIIDSITEEFRIMGKHPEDWNGRIRVTG